MRRLTAPVRFPLLDALSVKLVAHGLGGWQTYEERREQVCRPPSRANLLDPLVRRAA